MEFRSFQSRYHIQVQRLAKSTRLFRPVKNRDLFYSLRNGCNQSLCTERSVKTYFHNADLFACCHQVVNGFFNRITYRTHGDDHSVSVSGSVIVEQLIIRTDLRIYLVHVFLNNRRHSVIILVACLTCLEEDIRILSRSSLYRMVRIQSVFSERVDGIHIHHIFQVFVIPGFDLLDLMGSTESVKEIDERKASFDCRTVCNRGQVHNFLNTGFAEHCSSGLTTGIHIGVIAEDRQSMACKRTCRYVEHARKSLTSNLVQVRDHQKKTLGSCERGRKSPCCQRTVHGSCCARLGLHLSYMNRLSEDIGSSLSRPFISCFCHNG